MIKKILALTTLTVLSTGVFAAEATPLSDAGFTFSGSAALTSDYRFRGITQTQNDPALQGSFTLAHTSGLYFSTFASNVEFGNEAHLELDPQIGFTMPLNFGSMSPTLDVGALYYAYPSASDLNWLEFYGKLNFANSFIKGDSLIPSVAYTSEYGGSSNDGWNFNLAYAAPIADGFGGVASVGYSKVDDTDFGGGKDNYVDWKVGANYTVQSIPGLTAELAAVGTNIDTDGFTNVAKRGVRTGAVFTLTKAF